MVTYNARVTPPCGFRGVHDWMKIYCAPASLSAQFAPGDEDVCQK